DLHVDQSAIAIGSPLGLVGGPSVTVGVVSALHRRLDTRSGPPLLDMIQTDAPISPGSSGGALLDANGAVIGLTTAVATSDGAQGLGFATPIDIAHSAAEQLIAGGKVVHAWLGIEGTDVDPTTAKDMAIDGGALDGVFNVAPDGWMSEEEAKALSAGPVRVRVPRRLQPLLGPDVPKDVLPY